MASSRVDIGQRRREQGAQLIETKHKRSITMKTIRIMTRALLAVALSASVLLSVTGCRTAHGFGEDMERAGEKVQEGTDR